MGLRVRGGDERCVPPQHGGWLFFLTNNTIVMMPTSIVSVHLDFNGGCWYKVSFSSQMLLSTLYTFVLNPGAALSFLILALLFFLSLYTIFEYLCSLLRNSVSAGGSESLHYLTRLCLSYHSNSSSKQSLILSVIYYYFFFA